MAQKNNIRSIRFSDDLAELIDRQVGDTFTQKFENLITRCVWELPQKEEELRRIQQQINQERKRLNEVRKISEELERLAQDMRYASLYVGKIVQRVDANTKGAKKKEM